MKLYRFFFCEYEPFFESHFNLCKSNRCHFTLSPSNDKILACFVCIFAVCYFLSILKIKLEEKHFFVKNIFLKNKVDI